MVGTFKLVKSLLIRPWISKSYFALGIQCFLHFADFAPAFGQIAYRPTDCSSLSVSSERSQCFDRLSKQINELSQISELPGDWRLVRTPNPNGGKPAISIMHISDTAKSDPAFAGLSLRCGQTGAIEILLILIDRIEPKSQLTVAIKTAPPSTPLTLEASAAQGGTALILPSERSGDILKAWQNVARLEITIASGSPPIRGYLAIEGLPIAIQALASACTKR